MLLRFNIIFFLCISLDTVSAQDMARILNSNSPDHLKADSLDLLGRRYMLKGKRDSSQLFLEKALELAKQSGNHAIIARCYVDFAHLYSFSANYEAALKHLDMAWPYVALIDHYDVKISAIQLRANVFNFSGKKDSAIYYFKEAEDYNSVKDPYRNWAVYISMSELFNQTDDFAKAEKYLLKAYSLTVKRENKPDHGYVLTLFINLYMGHNKPANAGGLIAEYNELMEDRKRKNFVDPLHDLIMGLTDGKMENSLEFMKAVKESSLNEGKYNHAMIANGFIIRYYEKKKDYAQAIVHAGESEKLAAKTGSTFAIYAIKKIKYGLLQKAGKYSEAVTLADSLFTLKESMLVLQNRDQFYNLEKKYESEKKQKEIELLTMQNGLREKEIALLISDKKLAALLLQKELLQRDALTRENLLMDSIVKKEQAFSSSVAGEKKKEAALNAALGRENFLKAEELAREKKLRRVLMGGAALFLLAAGVILVQYRRQKSKSFIIQKQSDDLQVLMKEIHHRVKNNLQVISSLLDLQSMTITDNQASEAVKEGKNRVQSMALIHQNLYNEGNIKGIKAKEYISNLLQSLCDSYNITNDKLVIKTQIDDLSLDVDTMIPLGLVLNELVSNSLKYAFKDGRDGELRIILRDETHHLLLKVSDNGSGYPEGLNSKDGKSFGMKMIRAFAQKLKAKLDVYNDNGAVVEMQITKYQLA